jgi:outer membrane protein assembly factor BamB
MKSLYLVILSALTIVSQADDWPRYRGPNGSGISSETSLTTEWSDDKNLTWKTDLPGSGSSSPIISNGKIFIASYSGYGADGGSVESLKRNLSCIDQKSGEIDWTKTVDAKLPEDPYGGFLTEHGYASNTPVADGKNVYAFFGKSGAYAYDFSGKELWNKHLGSESTSKRWGSAASPILVGDILIINAGEESGVIYGLDKNTGEEKWKSEADSLAYAYGTPILMNNDLVIAAIGELWGMNPESGKLRWWAETGLTGNISPSVTFQDDIAFVYGGYPRTARVAVKTGGKGEVKAPIIWEETKSSYIPTPVVHEGHLYWVSDSGDAMCVDAKTGKLIYQERLEDAQSKGSRGKPFYASPVFANGNYYSVSRKSGTFVIKAAPKFEQVAHNKIDSDDSQFNATPAISDGNIYLRSDKALYSISKN